MNEIDTKKTQRINRSKSWFLKKLNKSQWTVDSINQENKNKNKKQNQL